MDFFRKTPRQPPSSLLVAPATRRMSTPAGDRLATILENTGDGTIRDHAQARRQSHLSGKTWSTKSRNGTLPRLSAETQPPPYASREWRPEDIRYFGNDEKPSLRRRIAGRRGGVGRFIIIAIVVLAVIIALAVGLGVGLSRRSKSRNSTADTDAESSQAGNSQYPLGQYTFVTSLRSVKTDCTSNPATWRCYPYSTASGSNSTSGLALFNWFITGASQGFPSNVSSPKTDASGIPTSLKISSSRDPFSIPLRNQSLTFVNDNNNPRYTFNFPYAKTVVPSTALGTNNAASTCYFNQTQFSATLYLSDTRALDYPGQDLSSSSQVQGGYPKWPYAVEVREMSGSGQDVPACYEMVNGALGERIDSLTPQSSSSQCSCNYRNFDA
ncbi:hypothetical protein B9Z65_7665 [Elsinoe australis]|uniref:Tat pathway signal sequence n=1 Tax=Elsinoe australis TaxID=40998 RepID=A0A2P8A062_9PEZI|nr:hypothetical protein B9Z65_7665 [Elsinoe australis]